MKQSFVGFAVLLDETFPWANTYQLDADGINFIHWSQAKLASGTEVIALKYEIETSGWFGIGFSRSGGMDDADMAILFRKGNVLQISDRHGLGNHYPPEDEQQDWEILRESRNGSKTVVELFRPVTTDDYHDLDLLDEPFHFIWAVGEKSESDRQLFHYHSTRGISTPVTLDPRNATLPLPLLPETSSKNNKNEQEKTSLKIPDDSAQIPRNSSETAEEASTWNLISTVLNKVIRAVTKAVEDS